MRVHFLLAKTLGELGFTGEASGASIRREDGEEEPLRASDFDDVVRGLGRKRRRYFTTHSGILRVQPSNMLVF